MKRAKRKPRYESEDEREYYQAEAEARARDARGVCEARWHPGCPALDEGTDYRGAPYRRYQTHHVRTRAKGGSHDRANLRFVCVECHHLCHARPKEAAERGLLHSERWCPDDCGH